MRRWKRSCIGVAALAAVAMGGVAGYQWLNGRVRPPRDSAGSAVAAVDEARHADAATWAPEQLRTAVSTLRASLAEQRQQEVRWLPFRNYATARAGFSLARSQALAATREARRERVSAEDAAATSLQQAERHVAVAERLGRAIPLDREGRRQLSLSRSALTQALVHSGNGAHERARELADEAQRNAEAVRERATHLAARYVEKEQVTRWRGWIAETIAQSQKTGGPAIVVSKEKHMLTLYVAGKPVRSYPADMGSNKLNDKLRLGDRATPEGRYTIVVKKGAGRSRYHRAMELDYPNASDLRRFERARRSGEVPPNTRPGGLIEIHGEGGRGADWTDGCVALSNRDIEDLFRRVAVGTPVTIVGGDGRGGVFSEAILSVQASGGAL